MSHTLPIYFKADRILVTPEGLCTKDFMNLVQKLYDGGNLNRLVVDEVNKIEKIFHL